MNISCLVTLEDELLECLQNKDVAKDVSGKTVWDVSS